LSIVNWEKEEEEESYTSEFYLRLFFLKLNLAVLGFDVVCFIGHLHSSIANIFLLCAQVSCDKLIKAL